MSKRTISFAKHLDQSRNSLPERFQNLERLRGQFQLARDKEQAPTQNQGSEMIRQEQPKPVLRPRSSLAQETDRSAFSTRLKRDDENARKQAFKQMRQSTQVTQEHSISKTYNQKKGIHHDRSV